MRLVAKERPELATGERHTVACINATYTVSETVHEPSGLRADGHRILINFASPDGKTSNPASFPVRTVLNDAGWEKLAEMTAENEANGLDAPTIEDVPDDPQYVAISAQAGIEMLQDFMFKAGIPDLDIQPGTSVRLANQTVSGLYREVINDRGVFHNWSMLGWRAVEEAATPADAPASE